MRRPVTAVFFSLFITSFASAVTISGKVTDAETTAPLPSMTVSAYSPAGAFQANATTDSAGRYSLTLAAGTYRFLAYDNAGVYATTFANDADSFESTPNVAVSGDLANLNFALRRAGVVSGTASPAAGSAQGIVVAAYNLNGSRRTFTITNASGAFNLVLPPGSYKLVAYDDAGTLWPVFYSDRPSFASANVVTIAAGQKIAIAFRLDVAAHLKGSVLDAATNQPLPDTIVVAYDASGVAISSAPADASGNFDVRTPAGSFRLVAADPRHQYATSYYGGRTFLTATPVDVGAAQSRTDLRIAMQRGGAIAGRITDSSALPLSVTVAAYNAAGVLQTAAQSDASGNYILVVPPGDYRIGAYDDTAVFATQFYPGQNLFRYGMTIHVPAGQQIGAIDISLPRGARIAGSVVDAATNAPASGIAVGAYDANGDLVAQTTTAGSGQYSLVVPAGTYHFAAYDDALRYATAFAGGSTYETSTTFLLRADSNARVDFRMTRGIRISGTVADGTGTGVSGVTIAAIDGNGNRVGTATSTAGTFQLILLPDRYRFIAADSLGRYATAFSASSIAVSASSPNPALSFILLPLTRHRAAPH